MPKTPPTYLFCLLTLWGCNTPTPHPAPSAVSPATTTLSAPLLNQSTLVEIKNDWNGYSDITPIVRHYKLQRQTGNLNGNGYFAVGGYGAYNINQQYTRKINIPAPSVQKFLNKLSETKLHSSSQYKPTITHADDYPTITIQLTTPQQQITFFSRSQGPQNTPWQIQTTHKQTKNTPKYYISNSSTPAQALSILKPYIDHPGLEQVTNKRRSKPKPPKTPAAKTSKDTSTASTAPAPMNPSKK